VQASRGKQTNGQSSVYAALHGNSSPGGLSYGQIDGDALRECVERVTNRGDAILFGRTTDGGALSVHVLTGGKAEKFYVTDASELLELITGLCEALRPQTY